MIPKSTIAAVLGLCGLAACQTAAPRSSFAMNGDWASADGIFVANFTEGRFTSRDARTGKVLAQGAYAPEGDRIRMGWQSATTQKQHDATCRFTSASSVTCDQAGASPFTLNRA